MSTTDKLNGFGPLAGVKVVELCEWVAAPAAVRCLSEMGATVIKTEPLHGDAQRTQGPGFGCEKNDYEAPTFDLNNTTKDLPLIHIFYSMKGRFWSKAIDEFINKWGSLPNFHMEQAYSAELAKQLKSRGIDVAFAAMTPEAAGLNHVHVWSQSLVACVNVENPLAQRTSITLDELKDERLLTYSAKSSVSPSIDELFGSRTVSYTHLGRWREQHSARSLC